MPLSTDEVLELMQSVAAEVITPRFRSLTEAQIDEKKPGDLVTVADHEAEELITKALLEAYPDAVVLGEEAYATAPELIDQFRAADHGFTFADVLSAFSGHELCSPSPWLHSVTLPPGHSYHPTATGQSHGYLLSFSGVA